MISPQEMNDLRRRMLIGAEAAHKIASSSDQFVLYDQEQYELVVQALLSLRADCRRLLAEHDILRAMFAEKLGAFFMEGITNGNASDSGKPVAEVPRPEGVGSGEAVREDDAGTTSRVPAKRASRKRAQRPKPSGDQAGDGHVPQALGSPDGGSPVDRVEASS